MAFELPLQIEPSIEGSEERKQHAYGVCTCVCKQHAYNVCTFVRTCARNQHAYNVCTFVCTCVCKQHVYAACNRAYAHMYNMLMNVHCLGD